MEKLITRCMPAIRRQCRYAAFSFHLDYNDLLSALLERIWRARHSFRYENGDKGFENWVGFVIYSVCIDMARKRKKETCAMPIESAYHIGAEHSIDHKNILEHVIIFAKNKFGSDNAIFLMLMDGMKYDDIAENLSIPVGTVKNKIHRMRKALQEANFTL